MKITRNMIYRETPEAQELEMFCMNESRIWSYFITPVIENLEKKVKKGTYDSEKAIAGFYRATTEGAKLYCKTFGSDNDVVFSVGDRYTAAKMIGAYIEEEYLTD